MTQDQDTNRILFLDNLRYLMVLLVVVLHAACSYSNFVPWWSVKEANTHSVFFDVLLLILDVFAMPVLFFIAGYFAISSYQKKGVRSFLKRKLKRLGLPLLLGLPLISPSFAYLYHYTRGSLADHMSFSDYWLSYIKSAGDFKFGIIDSIDHFSHSHLWFMSLLLFFFLLFALFAYGQKWHAPSKPRRFTTSTSQRSILAVFAVVGFLSLGSSFIANLIFASPLNPDPWVTIGNLLQFQPVKAGSYALYFCMGIYAYYHKWFISTKIPGHPALWTAAGVLLSICLLIILKRVMLNFSPGIFLLYLFVRSFLCITFLGAFITWTVQHWNHPAPIHALFARNSYYIYIIHFLVVVLMQLLLVHWTGGSVFIKFGIISLASIGIGLGISQFALRPYPRLSVIGIYTLFIILLLNIDSVGS